MSEFVTNAQLANAMRESALKRAIAAGNVMVNEVQNIIEPGSEEDRSQPGEPPRSQSGELESSIGILGSSSQGESVRVRVGTNLIKAWWLEFGSKNMEPRPFMRPAFESAKPEMRKEFNNLTDELQ